jgi:hypothetical protein
MPKKLHSGTHLSKRGLSMTAQLKHLVVVMMENRSFDHMLGFMKSPTYAIDGLDGTEVNRDSTGEPVRVNQDARYSGDLPDDPSHDFEDVMEQMFGTQTPAAGTSPGKEPPTTFMRNFCSKQPTVTPEAASLHRTAMTQPGVYFALDAPFVRIIALFSNALEDPGLISSQSALHKKWPGVPDYQLEFLSAQLQRIKEEKYAGAVVLATHDPPFSYSPAPGSRGAGGNHSSSTDMLHEIDTICKDVGVYPHVFLSGHAHNYQRFARTVSFGGNSYEVPFIVCGDGGHNVNHLVRAKRGQPAQEPPYGLSVSYLDAKPAVPAEPLVLKHYDDTNYGYLRITVDKETIRIGFQQGGNASLLQSQADLVTVELKNHKVIGN